MLKIGELLRPYNWSLLFTDGERGDLYFEIVVGKRTEKIKSMRLKMGEGLKISQSASSASPRSPKMQISSLT